MGSVFKILEFALWLGIVGGLLDATVAMRSAARTAHRHGQVSLGELNQLLGIR
jgi:hypothetical protein